jgi:hypothetical protein
MESTRTITPIRDVPRTAEVPAPKTDDATLALIEGMFTDDDTVTTPKGERLACRVEYVDVTAPPTEDNPEGSISTEIHVIIPQAINVMKFVKANKPNAKGTITGYNIAVDLPTIDLLLTWGDKERAKQTRPGLMFLFMKK